MTLDHTETQDDIEQTPEGGAEGETPALPSFEELKISEAVREAVKEMGFELPTEVQARCIPLALEGRDLLVQSRTGSGKTAAFGIPAASALIDLSKAETQALALAPTRELAMQVEKEVARVGARSELTTAAIYGGAAMGPQIDALKRGVHFLAATPGRLLDHIRRGNFDTSKVRLLVLDEADEMLSMGFLEEINAILDALPKERQTMLFSATIPGEIERLSERYLKDPKRLYLSEDFVGVREIDHVYYMVTGGDRPADLMKVLEYENPELALIFCNTRDDTARVAEFLDAKGFPTEGISSDLTQSDRERVMKRMRAGELRYLCATDIAARGIDIADLSHVINYSFPESADVYVHRTGRTGRAGRSGVAISLVSPREIGSFYYLKLIHKIYPEERHLPTSEEMTTRREGELHKTLVERYLGKPAQQLHLDLLKRVWSTADGARLLALALEEILEKPKVVRQAPVSRPPRRNERRDEERDEREDRDERPRRGGRERDRGGRRERGRSRDRGGRDRDRGRGGRDRDRGGRGRDSDHDDRRDRKRTRTRRNGESEGSASDESMPDNVEAFTTTDGDVELYETIEVGAETSTGDRGNEKRSRRRERRSEDEESQPGMARLYLNVGRRHNIHAEDIASFFQISGELSAEQIGNVTQRDRHSYINIAEDAADSAIERLAGKEISGRSVRIEHAKPRS